MPYTRAGAPPGFLLRIEDAAGLHGWGDAAPWPGFGDWGRAAELEAALRTGGAGIPIEAAHAWELATLDLQARRQGRPLAELLAADPADRVPVHTLVHDADEAVLACAAGATHLKIKVGRDSLANDDGRVWAIRASVGAAPRLRLDANGAWDLEGACEAIDRLKRWDIEWIEQPIPPGDAGALAQVGHRTGVAIAADEAVTGTAALEEIAQAGGVDVVVIKPMFVGGPRRAADLAARARALGLRAVITHAFGSPVDRAGALHVAAALGDPSLPCGVGTPPHGAILTVPTAPGLGVEVGP